MSSDKGVQEAAGKAIGANLIDVNGKATPTANGNVMRINRGHAVQLVYDVANENDDGTAGGLMNLEFDLYDESGSTIIWTGVLVDDIPIHVDLKGAAVFGGGVNADASDGVLNADASVLQVFNRIRFRVNVTVASNDTGTCLINVRALIQE